MNVHFKIMLVIAAVCMLILGYFFFIEDINKAKIFLTITFIPVFTAQYMSWKSNRDD